MDKHIYKAEKVPENHNKEFSYAVYGYVTNYSGGRWVESYHSTEEDAKQAAKKLNEKSTNEQM